MNTDRLLNKRVVKLSVRDLKEKLDDCDEDAEVVLCFNLKDGEEKVVCGYLAEVNTHLKYDGVLREKLEDSHVVELDCFNHRFCTYVEKK